MRDELQQLPSVGPSIARDLRKLGVKSVRDLARRDPERLYARLCQVTGQRQDPCVLYTFRCAVYAARTQRPKPDLLKWWNWKGRTLCVAGLLLATLVPAVSVWAAEAAAPAVPAHAEVPVDAAALTALVTALDRKMFDAYNAHDVDALMAMFAEDLEFYHDTGGLLTHEQVRAGFTSVFANNRDIRRDLVPGSLAVYPIKGYGAIQTGAHTFCHTENGKADCGTFQFVQIWRLRDGEWKVSREVSYGH